MVQDKHNPAAEQDVTGKPVRKHGCSAVLGWLILLLAAGAVLFFWLLKPYLEERGIDVDGKLEKVRQNVQTGGEKALEKAKETYQTVREKTPEVLDAAQEKVQAATQTVKEKTSEAVDESIEWLKKE